MIHSHSPPATAPQTNLQRLLIVRALFLLGAALVLAAAWLGLNLQLPYPAMLGIISLMTLVNLGLWWRQQPGREAGPGALCLQLLLDLLAITALLYCSGGASNPFVAYYLVPLCLAAASLPRRLTLPLFGIALASYTLLFFVNVPLPELAPDHSQHAHHLAPGAAISPHTLGMWFNFVLSALLIVFFVAKMASALRQQDAQLASLREETLRDEQLLAVATLAAGTAHELGTPLTTLKTLISEMQLDYTDQPALQADLAILKNQIGHCTHTLRQLHEQAGQRRHQQQPQRLHDYCQRLLDQWLLLRPDVSAHIETDPQAPAICAVFDPTIAQSISNLLNNAADACPHHIHIQCRWDTRELELIIDDNGPGLDAALTDQLGQAYASSKGQGRGLGLFLSHATLTRYGGVVHLQNRPGGGARTHLRLPLQQPQQLGDAPA